MDFDVSIKTLLESVKERLYPFIDYDIDVTYSKIEQEYPSDVDDKLNFYIWKTETEYFDTLIKDMESSFEDDYFMEMMSKEYWSLYEFGLFMTGWNTTGLPKECIYKLINDDDLCPTIARDMMSKACFGVNEGQMAFVEEDFRGVYLVNAKNLKSLSNFKVNVSELYEWFIDSGTGILPQLIVKYRKGELKVKGKKGALDDSIARREEGNCHNAIAVLIKLILEKWLPEKKANKSEVLDEIVTRYGSLDGLKEATLNIRLRKSLKVVEEDKPLDVDSKRLYFYIIGALYSILLQKRTSKGSDSISEIVNTVTNKPSSVSIAVRNKIEAIINKSIVDFNSHIQYDQRIVGSTEIIKGGNFKI